ncbi:RagB/SusD family nutrient uptake outer membrane protein [Sphingobacterium bambusae]|uniref:RagB/SusD family nutrient uptake outer membrane protein n=1 Tax=Sphingobacterium bambusae TaxID=662858 RepID=A0ABW6BJ99_9SPHI|nr:RagB/SusD family nutrient uptake outer membrane protein [Sphingobacterium bambusae]WPL49413.1 RagB/SusD family nutrient uptake outer membrane protein [Sphingobacterium bambusae]
MKSYLYTVIISCLGLLSCEHYLDISPPNNRLETATVFADSSSAALAISGTYSSIMATSGGLLESQVRIAALQSDELLYTGTSEPIAQFANNSLISDNNMVNNLWSGLYKNIYQVNLIIENVENSITISNTAKSKLIGEGKFLRAFLYFCLTNNWGAVPLVTGTDYRENEKKEQSTSKEVYALIVADLKSAIADLPTKYPTPERVRPTKLVAKAFLARVQLYRKNWREALDLSNELINLGSYPIETELDNTFQKNSTETIWQLFSATSNMFYDTYDGFYLIPSSLTNTTAPIYLLSPDLLASFAADDSRKTTWVGIKPSGPYYFPYKYTTRTRTGNQYTVVFRAAEQLLIRAEANLMMGDIEAAIEDINAIRRRAKISLLPSHLNIADCTAALIEERRRELFCEWGHRWFDLKRLDLATDVLGTIKEENWQVTDTLLPIPQIQLINAPQLVQNEGY